MQKKSKNKSRPRVSPRREHGSFDPRAPFFRGDTAERVIERRLAERAKEPPRRRRSSGPRVPDEQRDKLRTLKRLERNLPRRKTLEARQRLEARIRDLRRELNLEAAP